MTEISLREYLAKLDNLLHANAADEVIHHCRHILQYFPKNVDAYRFLGRALVDNGRWQEASIALQRVLSVVPDDFVAHIGLSEAFQNSDKPDDAIWHLERAFEQQPADKTLLDHLRRLYQRYRGVENAKIPLTAVAVARQSVKGRSFEQAADTLRGALNRAPQRIDLRLLLADVLWQKDSRIEAAELAIDVLEKLPDCLIANRIMTELWLAEGRPTDAQRYINRIESVDPYLAVEMVSKQPVDDNAFRLDELDYRRASKTEVSAERPDWLQDIDPEAFAPTAAAFVTTPTPAAAPDQTGALIEKEIPADNEWQEWVSAMLEGTPKPAEKPPLSGEEWLRTQSSLTDSAVLNTFEPTSTGELTEIDALFVTDSLSSPVNSGLDADDPIAWLRGAGIEVTEEEDLPSTGALLYNDDEEFRLPEVDDNPVAWMDKYGGADQLSFEEQTPIVEDDLMNWGNPGAEDSIPAEPEWQIDLDANDHLASPELPQLEEAPAPSVPEAPPGVPGPKRGLTAMLSETNFEWKQSADAQPEDEWLAQFDDKRKTAAVTTTTPDWLSALDDSVDPVENLDMPDTDDLTWLSNEVPQSGGARDAAASSPDSIPGGADEEFTWMSDFDEIEAAPTEAPITPAHVPDWLTELQPAEEDADQPPAPGNDDLDWMAAFDEPVASTDNGSGSNDEPEDDDDAFTWLEDAADVGSALPAANAVPDWMSELAPGEQALSSLEKDEDELDWMSAFDQADGDQAEAAQPEFDWMNEVPSENANSNTAADVETAEDDPFAWMLDAEASGLPVTSAPVTDSEFADLVNAEDDLESALTPDANAPDWLSELAPAAAAQFAVEPQINPAEVPDWLTELEPAVEAEVEAPAESLAVSSAAILEQDEFEWMDAIASEEADDEAEFAAEDAEFVVDPVAAVPDWLSELEPEADADFPAETAAVTSSAAVLGADEFAWMDAIASEEADDEAEFAVDPVAQVPDWLTELEPEADAETPHEPAAAVVGADEFAWMSAIPVDDGVEDEEFAVEPVADVPDWLSELEPEAEDQEPVAESDAVPVVGQDDLEWMSDFDEMADEPETEDAPIRVQSAAGQDDLEWISALDEPEVELTAEPEANAEPDEEFAWMDEVAAAETADSGVEFVPAAPESAAVAEYIVDGLLPLEAEEWAAPVPEDEMFPVMEEEAQAEAVQQITAGEGHELAVINDSDTFETPADNAPDWLNAMVPGLDVDYAPADEVVEEEPAAEPSSAREFAWLTNIVEEETNANAPSRFSFSKAPAWLQRLIPPAQPAASQSDTDLPDWASDDDADLPEWLR